MGFLPRRSPPAVSGAATAAHKGLPLLHFLGAAQLESWLTDNHSQLEAVWLKFAKKASSHSSVSYVDAREQALRFGWIDGLKNRIDDDFYALRFSQRRPRSLWSKINREIAETLIEEGRMAPPGMAAVEAARADGRWERAYDGASSIEAPDDFLAALGKRPAAERFFATISRANRFAILVALQTAASPETRQRRMNKLIAMLDRNEVPHPGA